MQCHFNSEDTQRRTRQVKETLRYPHCDARLEKWAVPDTPFIEWASDFQHICFNDECPYFKGGWSVMASQRNSCSCRFMYDPSSGGCHAIPVLTKEALRANIVHTVVDPDFWTAQ